jgi:hypothetical protein
MVYFMGSKLGYNVFLVVPCAVVEFTFNQLFCTQHNNNGSGGVYML